MSKSFVLGDVRRALDLDVTASAERDVLTLRQLQDQLFDEGGDVVVRTHLALPFDGHRKPRASTSIFMSSLTLTWHDNRQPFTGLAAVDVKPTSVGNMSAATLGAR